MLEIIMKEQAEPDLFKKTRSFINILIMHSAIGFNLYWLIFIGGSLLNDVITGAWYGFESTWVTLPLTLINLLIVKNKQIRILSLFNALLLFILISLAIYDTGNHDWPHFILRSELPSICLRLIMILPFALISFVPFYILIKIFNKFSNEVSSTDG